MRQTNFAEKTTRREAIMAQTDVMGKEIEDRHYSDGTVIVNGPRSKLTVHTTPENARRMGPDLVMQGYTPKNLLAEVFPPEIIARFRK